MEVVYKFGLLEVVFNFEESFRKNGNISPLKESYTYSLQPVSLMAPITASDKKQKNTGVLNKEFAP